MLHDLSLFSCMQHQIYHRKLCVMTYTLTWASWNIPGIMYVSPCIYYFINVQININTNITIYPQTLYASRSILRHWCHVLFRFHVLLTKYTPTWCNYFPHKLTACSCSVVNGVKCFLLEKKFSDKSDMLRCFLFCFVSKCFVCLFVFFWSHNCLTIMVTHNGHTIIPSYTEVLCTRCVCGFVWRITCSYQPL